MRVGILGGGQLGRMLALAGHPLGLTFRFFDPDPAACAGQVDEHVCGSFEDGAALDAFARGCDVITYEFENVPVSAVRRVGAIARVAPSAECLEVAQDRASEKTFFAKAGLDTPTWRAVNNVDQLRDAVKTAVGLPCVLKTRRGGYDGKGQAVIRAESDIDRAWDAIGRVPAVVEQFVSFTRELSVVAVRSADGAFDHYPLTENTHERGILRVSRAPAPGVDAAIEQAAVDHVRTLMDTMQYVGVLAVELFEVRGTLLANEMAPRVHNSGHWTIDGAVTSQFENHLRAVCGLPLGPCGARGASVMVNFIGNVPSAADLAAVPDAHVHLYGKTGRAGRKVGHATLVSRGGGILPPRMPGERAAADAFASIEPQVQRLRTIAAACDIA